MAQVLDNIIQANDIKEVSQSDYKQLASEIRRFLIKNISKTGGHLASNLGTVELTMALHLFMNFPEDKLVWDVGHQAYTHKILTGRKDEFSTLRTYDGLSGFPKRGESECDAFDTGHSSTSISAALGIVKARDLSGDNYKVAAVIGDGALSGGMAYEALNNAARLKSNFMIVLNDNEMSISENVGGMANYLGQIRTNSQYNNFKKNLEQSLKSIPGGIGHKIMDKLRRSKDSIKRLVISGMLFEDMGITYIGPIDGHDINQLLMAFQSAARVKEAVLVHVVTKKGKGYKLAEENPSKYHGVEAFNIKTGNGVSNKSGKTYTEVFSDTMLELGEKDEKIVAITAAMPSGTGLTNFSKQYPERFFDVGIAEEHAVTFAAGLAVGGMKPVVAIYSTFLQRAYDQIIHDVCINSLPVIFAIDRGGLVGNDGETHQGIFDITYLSHLPFVTLMAPKTGIELHDMLLYASQYDKGPIAIRYPRGKACEELEEFHTPIEYGKSEIIYEESQGIVLLAVGSMVETALRVRELLIKDGKEVTLVNVRFISPVDEKLLHKLAATHETWVTLEENIKSGGFGEKVSSFLVENKYQNITQVIISLPDQFIEQGEVSILKEKNGLDEISVFKKIIETIN